MFSINAIGQIDKKLIYRKRKGFDDVKKYTKTVNPDLPGQAVQKGYFKGAIEEWKTGGYSAEDIQAWNLYSRANEERASGFNMFTRFKIGAAVGSKTWERLTNCNIYDVKGSGFKVDINVGGDYSGKLYYGTSNLYMVNEVAGVFSVDKYTFDVTGLSILTNYYFYIKNTAIGKEGRTGIYRQKTSEYIPIIIDIGLPAIDRDNQFTEYYTIINKSNPANESGKIKEVEIWPKYTLLNCKVGTFFIVSGNYLTARDRQTIGTVTGGSKQTFSGLNINVEEGDFIGIFYTVGMIERDTRGYGGMWYQYADQTNCINKIFYFNTENGLSFGGSGEGN